MNIVIFATDPAPVSVKLVGACLAGLVPGILSGRLRADGKTIALCYLTACITAVTCLHRLLDLDSGLIAVFLGLMVGLVVFVLAPSRKASVLAAATVSLLALAALGLIVFLRMPPAEMRHAIAQIRRCGGLVQQSDNPGTTYRDQWSVRFEDRALDDDRLLGLAPELRKLPKLWLTLSSSPLGDRGLAGLAHAENLIWLDLDGTQVTDSGLPYLSNLTNLEHLDLSWTRISDEGLRSLSRLTNLKTLLVRQTPVTESGLEELRRSLPQCEIVCDEHRKKCISAERFAADPCAVGYAFRWFPAADAQPCATPPALSAPEW